MRRATAIIAALTALLASAAVGAAPSSAGCGTAADKAPTVKTLAAAERATLCLVNSQRTKRKLPAMRASAALTRAAQKHSADMVARRFYAPVNPDGKGQAERAAAEGYRGQVGENLYTASGAGVTPRQAVRWWMQSPDHRKNILTKGYRDGGLGIAIGSPLGRGPGGTYTNTFGIPAPQAG